MPHWLLKPDRQTTPYIQSVFDPKGPQIKTLMVGHKYWRVFCYFAWICKKPKICFSTGFPSKTHWLIAFQFCNLVRPSLFPLVFYPSFFGSLWGVFWCHSTTVKEEFFDWSPYRTCYVFMDYWFSQRENAVIFGLASEKGDQSSALKMNFVASSSNAT